MIPFIHWLYDDIFIVDTEIIELKIIPKCITWEVNKKIHSKDNIYIQIISEEDNIKEYFKENKFYPYFDSHLEVMKKTGIPFTRKNFFRSMNQELIISYFNEFNQYVLQSGEWCKRATNQSNMVDIFILLNELEGNPLNLQGSLKNKNPYLKFSPFTRTSRLRTVAPFFPIYNLEKSLRVDIKPSNDYIVEIDFNAAEFRIFLSLLEVEQPKGDAYEHIQDMFHIDSRSEAKNKVFEIIYSNHYKNEKISSILNKYVDNNTLLTPYGTKIFLDEKSKTINYLCQSTCSYLIYEKALECLSFLKDSKSKVLFTFHDAIIFDLHKDDIQKISRLKELISSTRFGYFNSRVKIGTNYFNLEEIYS